jgi:hypothetical protein
VTKNWTAGGTLNASASPYGNKGFVVFAKGGSGGVYNRVTDAKNTNIFPTDTAAGYSSTIIN